MAWSNTTAPRYKGVAEGAQSYQKLGAYSVFEGSIVLATGGYAGAFVPAASQPYLGVALETVDNSAGSNGDKSILVAHTGVFSFKTSGATQADLGKLVYLDAGSSGTPISVTTSDPGANDVKVGRIIEVVSATEVKVRVDGYALVEQSNAS